GVRRTFCCVFSGALTFHGFRCCRIRDRGGGVWMDGWMDGSARPGVTAIRVAKHTQVTNHFISPALSKQSIAYVSFDVGRDHITEKDFKPDHAIANNRSPAG